MSKGKVAAALEVVDARGVDPADERVHQTVDDRSPESLADDRSHRPVANASAGSVRDEQVGRHPERLTRAQDPRAGQRPPTGGHPEVQPVGHGGQAAACPHRGAGGSDRNQFVGQPELVAELGGFGTPGQEGVGGQVDRAAGEFGRSQLASHPIARLEYMHDRWGGTVPSRSGNQLPRRRQPGNAGADHGHRGPGLSGHAGWVGGVGPITAETSPLVAGTAARHTTSASSAVKRGSSLSDGVRANATPRDRAVAAASMSRS